MSHSLWWLVVNGLAVYRLSILVSKDKITKPLRSRIWGRGYCLHKIWEHAHSEYAEEEIPGRRARAWRTINELVICPWCLSVWFGGVAVAASATVPSVWQYPALALALSGATVLATRRA